MAQPHASRDQEAWQEEQVVTALLAEVQAIEERRQCAVRLHTLMNQRCPLEIPVQYERLFLRSPAGKRRKTMTIAEALKTATEGGYHMQASDGMDTEYAGANNEYSVWTRKDNASSFIIPVTDAFLDPHFWHALGRGLGWEQAVRTVHTVEHGRATMVTRTRHHWLSHWHRFIDHLADGNTPETFFASLTSAPTGARKEPVRPQRRRAVGQATPSARAEKTTKRGSKLGPIA